MSDFGARGRSDSRGISSFNDHSHNNNSDDDDAVIASSSSMPIHDPTATAGSTRRRESSVLSSSNVKTPSRSFYHRAFHGSLGEFFFFFFLNKFLPFFFNYTELQYIRLY